MITRHSLTFPATPPKKVRDAEIRNLSHRLSPRSYPEKSHQSQSFAAKHQHERNHLQNEETVAAVASAVVDPSLISTLLARIDQLECKINDMQTPMKVISSETSVSVLSSDESSAGNTNDVSMSYRVLSPPSSITGLTPSTQSAVTPTSEQVSVLRRRSRDRTMSQDAIEALASKIDVNHEHIERLDSIVHIQESQIRRQQETIHTMLSKPDLLFDAPLRIQRFMRNVVEQSRQRKSNAAAKIAAVAVAKSARRAFLAQRSAAIRIQVAFRRYCAIRGHRRICASISTIQRVVRGHQIRLPNQYASAHRKLLNLTIKLQHANAQLERFEEVCPITQETISNPLVCLIDGQTYESTSIMTWVLKNGTSPLSRESVSVADLVPPSKLAETCRALKLRLMESAEDKNEIGTLQQQVALSETKLEHAKLCAEELQEQVASEQKALHSMKLENIKLKQEISFLKVQYEAANSETMDLRQRLSSATRRSRSVQYERDEFHAKLAAATTHTAALDKQVREQNELHSSLLAEFGKKFIRHEGGQDTEMLLRMAVESSPVRSALEDSTWPTDDTMSQDSSDSNEVPGTRTSLETQTWLDSPSTPPSPISAQRTPLIAQPNRSTLEEATWDEDAHSKMDKLKITFEFLRSVIDNKTHKDHNIDLSTIELLLPDDEFEQRFALKKEQYMKMKKWQKIDLKKRANLF